MQTDPPDVLWVGGVENESENLTLAGDRPAEQFVVDGLQSDLSAPTLEEKARLIRRIRN
jgi:hypothetical protein